jgi:hypothetical protein
MKATINRTMKPKTTSKKKSAIQLGVSVQGTTLSLPCSTELPGPRPKTASRLLLVGHN